MDFRIQPREREAKAVAGLFRSSRLTLLLGEEGAGKTTLLKSIVLPIMERRDRNLASAVMAAQRVAAPGAASSDRRKTDVDGRYASVFFDRWDEAPLAGLREAIDDASRQFGDRDAEPSSTLADALIALSQQRGVRFLIVLDRFEAFLTTPESGATRDFTDQLIAALNTPFLPANFLISMRDDAEPLLEPLAQRVPGFGDARLRVMPLRRAPERSRSDDPARSRVDRGESLISKAFGSPTVDFDITTGAAESATPSRVDRAADDPSDHPADRAADHTTAPTTAPAIDHTIDRTADHPIIAEAHEPQPEGRLGDLLAAPMFDSADAAPRARPAPTRSRGLWLAMAIAAGVLLFLVVANRPDRGTPQPASPEPKTAAPGAQSSAPAAPNDSAPSPPSAPASEPSAATEAASTPAPTPTPAAIPAVARKSDFTIAVDAENSTATRMAKDLAKAVGRDGLVIELRATDEPTTDLLAGSRGEARLVIARRDSLEAARRSDESAMATTAARILMPLFTEELYFIVRADSPLRFVHQIEDKRINIGTPDGARALTSKSVYQAMFGKAIPATAGGSLDVPRALAALTRDRAIDAIVLVATQPAAFLTSMPRSMRERIKLLRLDGGHPAERRALRSYLPATLREDGNRVLPYRNIQTLAVMSFLLASPPADPAGAGRLEALASSLCRNLPALRRAGDPHWRAVRPGLVVDTKWPDAGAASASLRACGKTRAAEPRRKRAKRRR